MFWRGWGRNDRLLLGEASPPSFWPARLRGGVFRAPCCTTAKEHECHRQQLVPRPSSGVRKDSGVCSGQEAETAASGGWT